GGGFLDGCVDGLDGDLGVGGEGQVGGGTGDDRDAECVAVELALELRQDQGDSLGCTGGGRDDVDRCGTGTTQIFVGSVVEALVAGVGVDGGHQAILDAELVVEDLGHRCEAVGGAGCAGDDVVVLRVVVLVVDTVDEGCVLVGGRCGDDDLLGAGIDVSLGCLGIGEETGGLDNDINVVGSPVEVL